MTDPPLRQWFSWHMVDARTDPISAGETLVLQFGGGAPVPVAKGLCVALWCSERERNTFPLISRLIVVIDLGDKRYAMGRLTDWSMRRLDASVWAFNQLFAMPVPSGSAAVRLSLGQMPVFAEPFALAASWIGASTGASWIGASTGSLVPLTEHELLVERGEVAR